MGRATETVTSETFDSDAVVSSVGNPEPAEVSDGTDFSLDTFDYPVPKAKAEPKPAATAAKAAATDKKEELDKGQVKQVGEVKAKKEEDAKEKKSKEKDEEAEDKKVETKKDVEEKVAAPEEKDAKGTKTIVAKIGEEKFAIPVDAQIRVKVDGENKYFSLQELANIKSGEVSYDKKFSKLSEEKKQFEGEVNQYLTEKKDFVGHMNKIVGMLGDEKQDPIGALYYLLDLTGGDSYDVSQRILQRNWEEFQRLYEMDDVERDLHWERKRNEFLSKRQKSLVERQRSQETFKSLVSHVDQLREAYSISEEQYVDAHSELVELGYEEAKLTPQQVVKYAHSIPFVAKAEELIAPYAEQFEDSEYDGIVRKIAETLMGDQDISEEDISAQLQETFGDPDAEDIELLNKKLPSTQTKTQTSKKDPYRPAEKEEELDFF